MLTRRQFLENAVLAPLAIGAPRTGALASFEIICEAGCLSRESARGFGLVPAPACHLIVVCGAGAKAIARAPELRTRAMRGAWIIWESAPQSVEPGQFAVLAETLSTTFDIQIGAPIHPGLFIEYVWPNPALTRSFLDATPVLCRESEIVAHHSETPTAMRRRIGRGGIVFLGSMLGPNLYAEEPQAHGIATKLLQCSTVNTDINSQVPFAR